MLRQLLQYPVDQAHHAIAHDPGLQEANAYLARQIDCVLDPEANKVKAFKAKLANDRAAARSGVLKLAHIRRMCKLNNGAETRVGVGDKGADRASGRGGGVSHVLHRGVQCCR